MMAHLKFNIQKVAKTVAIIFAVLYIPFFFVAIAMANRPLPLSDIITFILMGVYIIGLLAGLKWPKVGALLLVMLPVFHMIDAFRYGNPFDNPSSLGGLGYILLLFIPAILYFLSWRDQANEK